MYRYRKVFSLLILLVSIAVAFPAGARPEGETIMARVVGVHDGDTITALTPQMEEIKIRLAEIDAPELGQPFGQKSKQMLSDLVFQKDITVIKTDTDKYGRTVARLYAGDTDVNRTMVKLGGAWAYMAYLNDDSIPEAEQAAKVAKAGLWALQADQIMPPWQWRREQKTAQDSKQPDTPAADTALWEELPKEYPYGLADIPAPQPASEFQPAVPASSRPAAASASGPACGSKRTCGQMNDCSEARFYLTECGLSGLDRDDDGTPCESLCR